MSNDWQGYDVRTLELILEDIHKALPSNDRLSMDLTHEQIVTLGVAKSAKVEICSIIEEKIRKLRSE